MSQVIQPRTASNSSVRPFDNLTEVLSPQRKADQMHCHDHRTTITPQRATAAALSSTARMASHPYSNALSRDFAYPREMRPKVPGRDGSNYYRPWGIPDPLAAAAAQAGYLQSNPNSNAPTSTRLPLLLYQEEGMEGKAQLPRKQKPHPQCRGEECEERGQGARREPIS
jgi:hypothetical protein